MTQPPRQHKRRDDPEDFDAYHERSQDVRPLGKINEFLDNWKIVWIVGFPIFLAFGFNFRTPGSQFEEIHKNQEIISAQQLETSRIISVLVFLRCEDIRDRQEHNNMAEAQLNCVEIYKKLPAPPQIKP